MLTVFDTQVDRVDGSGERASLVDDILPLLTDDDPLGADSFATHDVPLAQAPDADRVFRDNADGAVEDVFRP
jgi:hypothetical protein